MLEVLLESGDVLNMDYVGTGGSIQRLFFVIRSSKRGGDVTGLA